MRLSFGYHLIASKRCRCRFASPVHTNIINFILNGAIVFGLTSFFSFIFFSSVERRTLIFFYRHLMTFAGRVLLCALNFDHLYAFFFAFSHSLDSRTLHTTWLIVWMAWTSLPSLDNDFLWHSIQFTIFSIFFFLSHFSLFIFFALCFSLVVSLLVSFLLISYSPIRIESVHIKRIKAIALSWISCAECARVFHMHFCAIPFQFFLFFSLSYSRFSFYFFFCFSLVRLRYFIRFDNAHIENCNCDMMICANQIPLFPTSKRFETH